MLFEKCIYSVTMVRSKKKIVSCYGQDFWDKFKILSKENFKHMLPQVPDIGKESLFSFQYHFGPCYMAWYKAYNTLGIGASEIDENIWEMNSNMFSIFPDFAAKLIGKFFFNGFRKKVANHVDRQNKNLLHPYDWRVTYREINSNTFELDITECAYKKLAADFGAEGLLPGICRMDYLYAYLMGNGFERTKTLGDGDDCCNCRYSIVGQCKWHPEEGFIDRK